MLTKAKNEELYMYMHTNESAINLVSLSYDSEVSVEGITENVSFSPIAFIGPMASH